jgi:hypothetical protein
MINFHLLLIENGPSYQAIRKCYKKLALKYHPDHSPTPNAHGSQASFQALLSAYTDLTTKKNPPKTRKKTIKYCSFCSKGFNSTSARCQHIHAMHGNAQDLQNRTCRLCGVPQSKKGNLLRHENKCTGICIYSLIVLSLA